MIAGSSGCRYLAARRSRKDLNVCARFASARKYEFGLSAFGEHVHERVLRKFDLDPIDGPDDEHVYSKSRIAKEAQYVGEGRVLCIDSSCCASLHPFSRLARLCLADARFKRFHCRRPAEALEPIQLISSLSHFFQPLIKGLRARTPRACAAAACSSRTALQDAAAARTKRPSAGRSAGPGSAANRESSAAVCDADSPVFKAMSSGP